MSMLNQAAASFNTRSVEARLAFLFIFLLCLALCVGGRRLQVAREKKRLEKAKAIASEAAAELLASVLECEINTKHMKSKKRSPVSCRSASRPASEEAQIHPSGDLVVVESPLEEYSPQSEVVCALDCAESCASTRSIGSDESDDEISFGTDTDVASISEVLEPPPGLDHPSCSPEVRGNQTYSRATLLQAAVLAKAHAMEAPQGFKPLMLCEVYGLKSTLSRDLPCSRPRAWLARGRPDISHPRPRAWVAKAHLSG